MRLSTCGIKCVKVDTGLDDFLAWTKEACGGRADTNARAQYAAVMARNVELH